MTKQVRFARNLNKTILKCPLKNHIPIIGGCNLFAWRRCRIRCKVFRAVLFFSWTSACPSENWNLVGTLQMQESVMGINIFKCCFLITAMWDMCCKVLEALRQGISLYWASTYLNCIVSLFLGEGKNSNLMGDWLYWCAMMNMKKTIMSRTQSEPSYEYVSIEHGGIWQNRWRRRRRW